MPVKSGERWTTKAAGIPLEEITIRLGRRLFGGPRPEPTATIF
jgi:hypothetical protein